MKRREFAGLSLLAIGSLIASGLAVANNKGKKNVAQAGDDLLKPKPPAPPEAAKPNNNYFFTITTFFPRKMTIEEYKKTISGSKNDAGCRDLIAQMKTENKLINIESEIQSDKVISCFEFINKRAFQEYEERYQKIEGNSTDMKKKLGFYSKREAKRTVFAQTAAA